jgi:6,7-dimethyl-8-ribityllumazine synthase
MPTVFQGEPRAPRGRLAIVVSRYNKPVTSRLLDGALDTLASRGVPHEAIDVAWVPGAWEIPLAAQRLASTGRYAAVLCLGAVIRGETAHDQYINHAVSRSLAEIALRYQIPLPFGVLTCDTLEQALQRSGGHVGHKGVECAEVALEMVDLLNKLPWEPVHERIK